MSFYHIVAIGVFALLSSCASEQMPKAELASHDSGHNIPSIDNMIVNLKKSYISQCYAPILRRDPPENQCQTELFQLLERRYHIDYNQNQVNMASDELFFRDVDTRIRKMVRTDPEVREAVRNGAFRNADDMLAYYKDKYAFETPN